jgi:predicted ATPase
MIDKQIDQLSKEEQRVLEAASVAGVEFSALAVAAGLQEDVVSIEERCDELARKHQFIRPAGALELPGGTATARYSFIHALYQNALYDRVAAARRVQLHQRIGQWGEEAYGERAGEIAAELAMHFEQGRDYRRAVKHLQQAAENAGKRFANHETVALSHRALELLNTLPETLERAQQELSLRITLGVSLIATDGYAAAEVEENYSRARQLCQRQGEPPQLFAVLWGLWAFYLLREEIGTALATAEQLLDQAQKAQDPIFLVEGHWALGVALAYTGEFTASLERLERAVALHEPSQYHSHTRHTGHDPAVASRCQAAWVLWSLGQPDRALERIREALDLAEALRHPQSLTMAAYFAAHLHQLRREADSCGQKAQATIELATEHGLIDWMTLGTIQHGWALAEQGQVEEGLEEMRRGLAEYKQRGASLRQPYFLGLLAGVLHKTGQAEQALEVLAEALAAAHHTGDRFYEAELYRLKGEVLLMQTKRGVEAEGCLKQAVEVSRRQQAKSWELRGLMSLARLYRQQGKRQQARQRLEQAYGCFSEGLHTADLREAKALLDELS